MTKYKINNCFRLCFFLVIGAVFAWFFTTGISKANTSSWQEIKNRKILRVGVSIFKPWVLLDNSGRLKGFEIDIARKFAKDHGIEITFFTTSWDTIIPSLIRKQFDVIISGMSITKNRSRVINFSHPYSSEAQVVLIKKSTNKKLKTLADFNKKGIVFGIRRGTTGYKIKSKYFPRAQLKEYSSDALVYNSILLKNIDAIIGTEPTPMWEIKKHPNVFAIKFKNIINSSSKQGFAVAKTDDNKEFLHKINLWIKSNQDYIAKRYEYWFESDNSAKYAP